MAAVGNNGGGAAIGKLLDGDDAGLAAGAAASSAIRPGSTTSRESEAEVVTSGYFR